MEGDLISRSALLKAKWDWCDAEVAIRNAPGVEAEVVVHAQWDVQGWEDDITGKWHRCGYRCSHCGQHSAIKWPGCPWCRAKMDGDRAEGSGR
jgi:hypothetical protein